MNKVINAILFTVTMSIALPCTATNTDQKLINLIERADVEGFTRELQQQIILGSWMSKPLITQKTLNVLKQCTINVKRIAEQELLEAIENKTNDFEISLGSLIVPSVVCIVSGVATIRFMCEGFLSLLDHNYKLPFGLDYKFVGGDGITIRLSMATFSSIGALLSYGIFLCAKEHLLEKDKKTCLGNKIINLEKIIAQIDQSREEVTRIERNARYKSY